MAVSTVHHWADPLGGLREMRWVVVLTFDTDERGWQDRFWLTRDYLPEFATVLSAFPWLAGMAGPATEERAVRALGAGLGSGRRAERNSDIVGLDAAGLGLRLLTA